MAMKSQYIESVSQTVYRQFPEMRGARPTVQAQSAPGAKSAGEAPRHLLTFKGQVDGAGGRKMLRVVRVVADDYGKILKISTSK